MLPPSPLSPLATADAATAAADGGLVTPQGCRSDAADGGLVTPQGCRSDDAVASPLATVDQRLRTLFANCLQEWAPENVPGSQEPDGLASTEAEANDTTLVMNAEVGSPNAPETKPRGKVPAIFLKGAKLTGKAPESSELSASPAPLAAPQPAATGLPSEHEVAGDEEGSEKLSSGVAPARGRGGRGRGARGRGGGRGSGAGGGGSGRKRTAASETSEAGADAGRAPTAPHSRARKPAAAAETSEAQALQAELSGNGMDVDAEPAEEQRASAGGPQKRRKAAKSAAPAAAVAAD